MAETWPVGTRDIMRSGTIIEVADELTEGSCKGCFFFEDRRCNFPALGCSEDFREDKKPVIFTKIEPK